MSSQAPALVGIQSAESARSTLIRRAKTLSLLSIGWMTVEAGVAILAALLAGSPDQREGVVGHSAFVYGITGSGSVLVLYPPNLEPAWIVHDVPLLAAH